MKQTVPNYTYNKTSGVIVLSGLTIDRDQLLLIVNTTRNVTYYNFADSATTLQSYVNPSAYKGFYDNGGLYNIGDIVQTNGNPYGTAGGFFIRLQAPNAGYPPAVGGGSNSHWSPTSASGTTITLNASVISSASSHNNADALTIYYDDQISPSMDILTFGGVGTVVAGSEHAVVRVLPYSLNGDLEGNPISTANPMPIIGTDLSALNVRLYKGGDPVDGDNALDVSGTVTAVDLGAKADAVATTDTGTFSVISLIKRGLQNWTSLLAKIPTLVSGRIPVDGSGVTQPVSLTSVPSHAVTGTFWQTTQPVSGPLTDTQLRATAVSVSTIPSQGTSVTNSDFTSLTPSASLVSAVAGRRVLSVFNEGAGVLYISAGGTCTTASYQVRLGVGEYWECPAGQLALAHTAVFGTTGTARVSQVT